MKSFMASILFLLLVSNRNVQAAARLERLNIDPNQISVSGVSSGAMMAVQLNVIYSSWIHGMGSIAGGVFACAENNPMRAVGVCMKMPEQINVQSTLSRMMTLAKSGQIDPLENLRNSRIFIYAGQRDTIVNPKASNKLLEMYKNLAHPNFISIRSNVPAGHGQPTLNYGNACEQQSSPWLNNCGYDGAGEILTKLYGKLKPRGSSFQTHFRSFDQIEFGALFASMNTDGFVYVPEVCAAGSIRCRLHIALHGCQQSPQFVRDAYLNHAGYNEWAETNAIVVLYPTVGVGFGNPNACWDWWGYTGADYLTYRGKQVQVIKSMVSRLFGKTK